MLKDEILNNIDMLDIFRQYGFKPNRGGFICCPFHKEKTASLKAYGNNKRFKCFGCGKGGNIIDFVMELFNIDFKQALARLAYDFNISANINGYSELRRQNEALERRRAEQDEKERKAEESENLYYDLLMYWERLNSMTSAFAKKRGKFEVDWASKEIALAYIKKPYIEYLLDLYDSRERRFGCG